MLFSGKIFQDKKFDKSSVVVRRLLKELQGVSESTGKLRKKCSVNLIGRDSEGLWLKEIQIG